MKKIWTKSVFEYDTKAECYVLNETESEFYFVSDDAPVAYCKGESGGGSSTTVQKSDPWEGQQPYLVAGFKRAVPEFLAKNPSYYPGSTVVPFSPETNMALDLQTQRALNGSPIQTAGTAQLSSTLNGDYLNNVGNVYNNPMQQLINNQAIAPTARGDHLFGGDGFNAAVNAATNKILPGIDSAFERSGRTGSGLAQQAKTSAIADAFAGQYAQERQNQLGAAQLGQAGTDSLMNNLGRERDNQIRSMMFAPQMASLDYQDFSKLAEVGAQREGLAQENLSEQIARHDYNENIGASQLAKYMNLIQGNYGGTSTSTSSGGGGSSGPNFLGGAGGMLGAYSMGVNPMFGLLSGLDL